MAKEFNERSNDEYNPSACETNNFVETEKFHELNDQACETAINPDEYNEDTSSRKKVAQGRRQQNGQSTSSLVSKLSALAGTTAAALVGVVIFVAVAIVPAYKQNSTFLTAEFTSLASVGTEICYALDLGSSDESFVVTDEVYEDTTLNVSNSFTNRSYKLSDIGLVGKVEGLKESVTYTLSVEYDGVRVCEKQIKTGSVSTPSIMVGEQCRCGVDGNLYFWFMFSGDVSAFSDFEVYLTDEYEHRSDWTADNFYSEDGSVICTEITEEDETYGSYYKQGYRYITFEQAIRVSGVLGGGYATIHISYSVYGDADTLILTDVEI